MGNAGGALQDQLGILYYAGGAKFGLFQEHSF